MFKKIIGYLCCVVLLTELQAVESETIHHQGLKLRLISDTQAIVAGKSFTVGLFLEHEKGYHTYWKFPGVVGLATKLKWTLPEGVSVGETLWPAPMLTKMADVTAYGYETDTCLMSEMKASEHLVGDKVELTCRVTLMCCAKGCYPGFYELTITLPVVQSEEFVKASSWKETFNQNRLRLPQKMPDHWEFSAERVSQKASTIILEFPELDQITSNVYFFGYDQQVDSDVLQQSEIRDRKLRISVTDGPFAEKSPKTISGVLHYSEGWPGLKTQWIEVEYTWPRTRSVQ